MKTVNFLFVSLLATSLTFAGCKKAEAKPVETPIKTTTVVENTKIQVALLLDTSNSMDGLIEQAKSRLWNIVNTLTTLKYAGKTPDIEISLYEYGNSGLSQRDNYIKQITPLSTDLDLISEKLFALKTNGGEEYCGAVIADANKQLSWGKDNNNMKLIYVCGNEGFDQGSISYKESIADALKNNIYVNTIFCGNQEEGINSFWKNGADIGKGKYFTIDSNQAIQYVTSPYDDKINKCNERINLTYINYGADGYAKKANQAAQDKNAESLSPSNYTERAVSKSKSVYKNESWDLVDKMKDDKVKKIKKEELPKEYQDKSSAELTKIVEEKAKERKAIQKEIGELAKKRQEYIDVEAKKSNSADDLGGAINASIITLAKAKGYTVAK
jgi:von Willebrand factor type A domain